MDAWLPFGRMPREGNHLAGPGRLAGRQSSLHVEVVIIKIHQRIKLSLHFKPRFIAASINHQLKN